MHREGARARMRVLVKKILRKYGYPPDLQDGAVQTVLQQAEAYYTDPLQRPMIQAWRHLLLHAFS